MLFPLLGHIIATLINIIAAAPTTVKPTTKITTTPVALKKDSRQWYAVPNPAYLGDPCAKDSDCKVEHSVCVSNTNIWWNGQPFCTCGKLYEPRTGDCILKNATAHTAEPIEQINSTFPTDTFFTPVPTAKPFPLRTFDSALQPTEEIDLAKLRIRQVIEQIAQIRHTGNLSVRDSTEETPVNTELTQQPQEAIVDPTTVAPVLEVPQLLPDWVTWVQVEPQKHQPPTTTVSTTTVEESTVQQSTNFYSNSVVPRKAADLANLLMASRLAANRDSQPPDVTKQIRSEGGISTVVKTNTNCALDPNANGFAEMTPDMLNHFNDTITRVIGSLDSLNTHEIRDLFKEAVEKVLNMYLTRVVVVDHNGVGENGINRKPLSQSPVPQLITNKAF